MRKCLRMFLLLLPFVILNQAAESSFAKQNVIENQIVEASCGQCHFGLKTKTKGCDLAVRIDGKAYFVDGAKIDSFGDAHAKDGFCQRVRKARVSGTIANDRFQAKAFELLPLDFQAKTKNKNPA